MGISFDEQETIIIFNRSSGIWEAGTNIASHKNMFEKKGWKHVRTVGEESSYEAPKNAITFRTLNGPKREVSEEQKERLRAMRKMSRETTIEQGV